MRLIKTSKIVLLFLGIALLGCLDPYEPPVSKQSTNYLVIDGIINSTDNLATVKISRAINLSDTIKYPAETGATVFIEDEASNFILLTETETGLYSITHPFDSNVKYRLKVTVQGKEYFSDFIKIETNAIIDSLSWSADNTDFAIYVNSHDFSEGVKYYRYTYEETYEYNSVFSSGWKIEDNAPRPRPFSEDIHTCWITRNSSNIILASTENLNQNLIAYFPAIEIERGDRRLWNKYSLLVKQFPVNKKTYDYWFKVRQITESLGGLFDPLPYKIDGNIKAAADPDETVIGYFSGGEVAQKRVVVPHNQLPINYSGYKPGGCLEEYVPGAEFSSLLGRDIILTRPEYMAIFIIGWHFSTPECVDCRLQGGTTVEPDFMK